MPPSDPLRLLRAGTVDAELAALLWLLLEGGVPLVVAGTEAAAARSALAAGLLSLQPAREWVVLDADAQPLRSDRLVALLRGGVGVGVVVDAADLATVLQRLVAAGLPEDGVRRLGVVAFDKATDKGARLSSVHYLRPTERDGQGHVQRRPPAVLAAWDEVADAYEHYAWGITPELAQRVDRSQADLELRQRERTAFLAEASSDAADMTELTARIRRYLEAEPPREPTAPSGW
jgi:hypothetical protein